MNKTCILVIFCFLTGWTIKAQTTIEYCQTRARENYPLIRQHGLIEKTAAYTTQNARRGYLPQFSIFGRASYQSDVPTLPKELTEIATLLSSIPGMPDWGIPENGRLMNKDQYNIGASATQLIWDGGAIAARQAISGALLEVETSVVEVELYKLNNQVNELFFGILLLERQLAQQDLYSHELQSSYNQVKAYVDNGLANESDLDLIQAMQYANEQNKIKAKGMCRAFRDMLSLLMGEDAGELQLPDMDTQSFIPAKEVYRPELALFDKRNLLYDSEKKAVGASYMPHISLFAHAGYGNPNLSLIYNKWDTYFIGGLSLGWNFGSLYTRGNQLRTIELRKQRNEVERSAFLFNVDLQMTQGSNEIQQKRDLLVYDSKIVDLRSRLKEAARVKAENGVMSVEEWMREVDAEEIARQNEIIHKIDLLLSIYHYKYISNNN